MLPKKIKEKTHKTLAKSNKGKISHMFNEEDINPELVKKITVPKPSDVMEVLNREVIGQEKAKKTLSVAICNHFKRVVAEMGSGADDELSDVKIEKSNVMILGESGTGKTHMIKTIAKELNLPCYIADATKLTESGYVGDDVETILTGLLIEADYDLNLAQMGIVCIDEIDKLSKKGANMSLTRDVGGEGVQQGLLKIVEGSVIGVPPFGGRKHPEQRLIYVDTTNILFIGMGAFDGIENIISTRMNVNTIGFNTRERETDCTEEKSVLSNVNHDDLIQYGVIPELCGRFPVIANTEPLEVRDLERILTEPKNSLLKQYRKLMRVDGINLIVTDEAITEIATYAASEKTGARSLRGAMEEVLMDVMFNPSLCEGNDFVVDAELVKKCLKIENKKKAA